MIAERCDNTLQQLIRRNAWTAVELKKTFYRYCPILFSEEFVFGLSIFYSPLSTYRFLTLPVGHTFKNATFEGLEND